MTLWNSSFNAVHRLSLTFRVNESTVIAVRLAVAGTFLGRVILEFPFLAESVGRFGQPLGIVSQRFDLGAGKVFTGTRCRASQGLQQAEADQDGDVIRFKTEPPSGFSGVQPPGNAGRLKISLRSGFIRLPFELRLWMK